MPNKKHKLDSNDKMFIAIMIFILGAMFFILFFNPPKAQADFNSAKAMWEAQMLEYGKKHCDYLYSAATQDQKLANTYYDGERVFFNIHEYTKDPKWIDCALKSQEIYGKNYVGKNNGNVPGYWNFTTGLYLSALRGNAEAKGLAILLSKNAAYARDTTPPLETVSTIYSRESAYAISSYLNAEKFGEPRRTRLTLLTNQSYGYFNQWFVTKTAPYVRPFMVALTSEALIEEYTLIPDERLIPNLKIAAEELWKLWLPEKKAFRYTNKIVDSPSDMDPAPDLNLLIAPIYAYLWSQTLEPVYLDRADQIFEGGVTQAYLVNAKQFNQNYRWSFDYLKWRSALPPVTDPCVKEPAGTLCTNHLLKQILEK